MKSVSTNSRSAVSYSQKGRENKFGLVRSGDESRQDVQCESGFIESPLSEINFLISLAWAKGVIDVGDPMIKIEKCCKRDRAPPTPQKSENKFRFIWLSMRKDSQCNPAQIENLKKIHETKSRK